MKLERRGKFAGVKIHLDADECHRLSDTYSPSRKLLLNDITALVCKASVKIHLTAKECQDILSFKHFIPLDIQKDMSASIKKAITKDPTILDKRTPEQVKEALENEQEKAETRLDQLNDYLNKISGY
jgi:hypothetical protein